MDIWQDFIVRLTKIDLLRLARDEVIEDWGNNIPVTLLFASLGKKIVEHFDEFSTVERLDIFNVVENGMKTSDDALKAFMATGLLEALFSRASSEAFLWERIDEQLGERSRNYLVAWRESGSSGSSLAMTHNALKI